MFIAILFNLKSFVKKKLLLASSTIAIKFNSMEKVYKMFKLKLIKNYFEIINYLTNDITKIFAIKS